MNSLKRFCIAGLILAMLSVFAAAEGRVSSAACGQRLIHKAADVLSRAADYSIIKQFKVTGKWTWIELDIYDEEIPITIDIVANNYRIPKKIIYLLPGAASNFSSSFFTPVRGNMAHFFRNKGYLVVGITPREDNAPAGGPYEFMADWGLQKHKDDIRKIVKVFQSIFNMPYDMLGHSYGAVYALDYAGSFSDKLEKVIAVDIDYNDPVSDPAAVAIQNLCYSAYAQLVQGGAFADPSSAVFKEIAAAAAIYPTADSGESRAGLGLPGNFTLEGLLYFAGIYTGMMPGPVTGTTGVPGDWGLIKGNLSGIYNFDPDPLKDTYEFSLTGLEVVTTALNKCNSGVLPMAVHRDFCATASYNGAYDINWAGIGEKVVWVNMEYGYGHRSYGAQLIKNAGNKNVRVFVVPGYAHADVLWSPEAKSEAWPLFLE